MCAVVTFAIATDTILATAAHVVPMSKPWPTQPVRPLAAKAAVPTKRSPPPDAIVADATPIAIAATTNLASVTLAFARLATCNKRIRQTG